MKSLYDPNTAAEVKQRIAKLEPASQALWGKMNAGQALAHCSAAIEVPLGDKFPKRLMVGRVLGWMFKPVFSNEKELKRNTPTDPTFIVTQTCDLEVERERLTGLLDRFVAKGAEACSKHPHSFFGNLTANEWGVGMYKHLDHHLRQFGV